MRGNGDNSAAHDLQGANVLAPGLQAVHGLPAVLLARLLTPSLLLAYHHPLRRDGMPCNHRREIP
jgi:hypothetical protein